MKDDYKRVYIGKSYGGIDFRVIGVGSYGFIERNHSHDKNDWFLIAGILLPIEEAIKKTQEFVKKSYTANFITCPYNF